MQFEDALRGRRSVRRYRPDPVDARALERIVDAYRRGPSAGFSQGQHLVVVTDGGQRQAIAAACREPEYLERGFDPWISVAPVHFIPCVREADYRDRYAQSDKEPHGGPAAWSVPFWWMDGGAAVMLAMLAAVNEGLGTGFLDLADRPRIRAILALPDDVEPLGLLTLGHPLPEQPTTSVARGRRPAAEVVHRGRW